jgi:hypothetical protein
MFAKYARIGNACVACQNGLGTSGRRAETACAREGGFAGATCDSCATDFIAKGGAHAWLAGGVGWGGVGGEFSPRQTRDTCSNHEKMQT